MLGILLGMDGAFFEEIVAKSPYSFNGCKQLTVSYRPYTVRYAVLNSRTAHAHYDVILSVLCAVF